MSVFGRKRHMARQEARAEQLAESYQCGLEEGRKMFALCLIPSHYTQIRAQRKEPFAVGVLAGWQSAKWEFEDECLERLEALGQSVIREAEEICRMALPPGWDGSAQDIHGSDEQGAA